MTESLAHRSEDDAVAEVYSAYRSFLVSLMSRKFRVPEDDALGLVHEVFLSFLRCRREIENQRAWLVAAACNAARGYWSRKRTSDAPLEAAELEASAFDLDVALRVAEVLRRVPERWRRVLELHYIQGHSAREIAAILKTTPGYAEKLVHEGLERARAAAGEAPCI